MIQSDFVRYSVCLIFILELSSVLVDCQRFDLAALSNLRAAANQPNLNTRNGLRNNLISNEGDVSTCADKDIRFELITGYVFTAPNDMLDSRPGTLM